jgi:tRNA wybutosine-synthesizing protein 2
VRKSLAATLPPEALARLPRAYFRLGDVLLVDLPLPEPEAAVAEAYARVLRMRSVLGREGGIEGELRRPRFRHLWGDDRTETVHHEVGLRFRLDPAQVMWSPGNLAERQRLSTWRIPGETVVDLFAGVGYLCLVLAHKARPARVVALEKSPVAHRYLEENIRLNELQDVVEGRLGDCRDVAPRGEADRVLLGLLPDSMGFLDTALDVLRPRGGFLHVHRVTPRDAVEAAWLEVEAHLRDLRATPRLVQTHIVKSYAPRATHVVFDVEVRR